MDIASWPRDTHLWAVAAVVNITIDDTSSLILYSTNNTWRPSKVACQTCLAPDPKFAYAGTWHDGTHIIPTLDDDDINTADDQASKQGDSGAGRSDADGSGDGGSDNNKGNGGGKWTFRRRRRDSKGVRGVEKFRRQDTVISNPFFTPKLDSDDPGFFDRPVTVEFNFTGTSCSRCTLSPICPGMPLNTPRSRYGPNVRSSNELKVCTDRIFLALI